MRLAKRHVVYDWKRGGWYEFQTCTLWTYFRSAYAELGGWWHGAC